MHRRTMQLICSLACLLCASSVQAGEERIFTDGFDPCCSIGGTVSGLSGNELGLHLAADSINEDRPVPSNGLYQFAASVPPGTAYALSVSTHPSGQTCTFSITGGIMGSSPIENADVVCGGNLEWDSGNWGENWN